MLRAKGDRPHGPPDRRYVGSVDIIVNNARIQHVAPIEEFSAEKWDASDALKDQPNTHFVEVAELAALALFLCTDNGASVTVWLCPWTAAGPRLSE